MTNSGTELGAANASRLTSDLAFVLLSVDRDRELEFVHMSSTWFDWRVDLSCRVAKSHDNKLSSSKSQSGKSQVSSKRLLLTGLLACCTASGMIGGLAPVSGQGTEAVTGNSDSSNATKESPEQESPEQQRERITAERFLTVLLRRPTRGTSLDRVFSYHIGRGDIGDLIERLSKESTQQADDEATGRYMMVVGLLQLQRGEDAEAVKALTVAKNKLPQDPLASNYLGEALLLVGQENEATEAFADALEKDPPKQEYLKIAGALGRLHQRAGRQEEALQVWKQLEEAFPGDQRVRERIAHILVEEGDIEGALQRYEALSKAARTDNEKVVYAMRAAELQIRSGQKEDAIKRLESLIARLRPGSYLHNEARRRIESAFLGGADYAGLASYYENWIGEHPDDVDAIVRLARTLSVQGRTPEAIEWFEKAIKRAPSETEPRLALIDAYVAAERFGDAAEQYQELSEIDQDNPDHLVRWGQVILQDKKQDKEQREQDAADVWMRLAELRSEDAVVQSQVADLLRDAGLEELALKQYRKALDSAPQEPQYKEYLGEYLHKLDRKDEAITVWKSLAEGDLRTRKNLVRLAEIFKQFDRFDDALKVMSEACQLDPTIDERLQFAQWLREDEQFDESIEQIQSASKLAESLDDAERVFAEEVKTYQAAGKLEERIAELVAVVDADNDDSTAWRRLAVLYNASQQPREATEAIEKAIELTPDSVESLVIAAQMYEDSARLREAIQKRRLLADTDSRFRSGHLQKLSSLYLQIGEQDKAMSIGDELLASSGGSVESFRFYADLCARLGKIDLRLDSLRRCVRMNPRSIEAQRMLATQLAEDFKTDQAIELYWQMLDESDDLDVQRGIVEQLADLYLRSNRLDQLITRLEIRGRESGDRRSTTDLTASAYAQVGDVGLAIQTLEGLLQESGRDTMLLERLVTLSQQAGEYDEALSLQRQLTRLSPDRKNEAMLASLLLDTGALTEAEAIWTKLSESASDSKQLTRNLNRLLNTSELELAIKLANNALQSDSKNWEMLVNLMALQAKAGDWEKSASTADQIISLDLPDSTLPEGGKPYEKFRTVQGRNYPNPPIRYVRYSNLYSLQRLVDERYGYSSNSQLPTPMDLGQAKIMALYCKTTYRLREGEDVAAEANELEKKAMADDATADQVWDAYIAHAIVSAASQTNTISYQDPSNWDLLWLLQEKDPESGEYIIGSMLMTRARNYQRTGFTVQPMPEDRLDWLRERVENPEAESSTDSFGQMSRNWLEFYIAELRIAGQREKSSQYAETFVTSLVEDLASETMQPPELSLALSQVALYGNDDQLWKVINVVREKPDVTYANSGANVNAVALTSFSNTQRVTDGLSLGIEDETFRERLFQLIDRVVQVTAEQPLQQRHISIGNVGGARSTYKYVNGNYRQVTIDFPPRGLGPDDSLLQQFHNVWEQLDEKDLTATWLTWISDRLSEVEQPVDQVWQRMMLACVLQWDDQSGKAADVLSEASGIASDSIPMLDSDLKLMLADLNLRAGRKEDALSAIESISIYDRQTMAIREFAAAKLSAAVGNAERAKLAARRLFGVRLNTEAQIELAKLMGGLGMKDLATDLVRRMRSRSGSSIDQLQSIMSFFYAQQQNEQAAEVAMELLRRSTPTQTSRNYRTTEQVRRTSALQMLANTGRLMDLIKKTEERFENAPNSSRIRMELTEMYDAAGQKQKALALMGSADLDSVNGAQALEATAKQFTQAGKMDEACDAYLKLLRRDQSRFSNQFYDILQPFERQRRLPELADLMIEVGVKKFTPYRVAEVCDRMLRVDGQLPKAKELFAVMLDSDDSSSNWNNALSNVAGDASKLLDSEELVRKLADSMVRNSKSDQGYERLFAGYSTHSDGRHNNVTTYFIRHLEKQPEMRSIVEKIVKEQLAENDQWHSGKVWLGLLYVADEQFAKAKEVLEPVVAEDAKPAPTYDMIWLVGSYIDTFKPMAETADQFYQRAMTLTSNRNSSEFRYSLPARYCNFLKDNGNKEKARTVALEGIEKFDDLSANYGNAQYEAYRKIQSTQSILEFFSGLGYPADGLRFARDFDRSLFQKAGQYGNARQQEQFEKLEQSLLDDVLNQGGVAASRSFVNAANEMKGAVDFAISTGDQPFTGNGFSSIWLDVTERAVQNPEAKGDLDAFEKELQEIADNRPDDQSVSAAIALLKSLNGDSGKLRSLIGEWLQNPIEAAEDGSGKSEVRKRRDYIILLAIQLLKEADQNDQQLLMQAFDSVLGQSANEDCTVLAELGKAFLKRGDKPAAEASWKRAVTPNVDQWKLLDLSEAAAKNAMLDLSAAAFDAAIAAPERSSALDALKSSVSSLSDLFGSAQSGASSNATNPNAQVDADEIRLARRMLELDKVWREAELWTRYVYQPYVRLVLPEGKDPRPLFIETSIKNGHDIVIDSVFDQLAKRVHWSDKTDNLLSKIKGTDITSELLATLVLLRAERAGEALKHLQKVSVDEINSIRKELPLQVISLALKQTETREYAAKLGLSLINANRPTERYDNVNPFDHLALTIGKVCLNNNLDEKLASQALRDYLELTEHYNARYTDVSSQLRRRANQLEEVARLLLPRGMMKQAMLFLAMRSDAFNAGLDTSLDWVGCWALESYQGSGDHAVAYHDLADWTFSGDGALNVIQTLARRQPLPDWIPADVGGHYPPFPPVADTELPIVTNYYFLTRLAQETGMRQDLLDRLAKAQAKERAGADVALAIALAAFEMEIDPELINRIGERTKLATPEFNGQRQRVTLAAMQLASMLAQKKQFEPFVKQVTDAMLQQTHSQGRGFLHPWISKFNWKHGWADSSDWQNSDALVHWATATQASSHERYEGKLPAHWVADGEGNVSHVAGFGYDYFWLKYPLEGNFSIEMSSEDGGWTESSVIVDGIDYMPNGSSEAIYVNSDGSSDWVRHFTKDLNKNQLNDCRVVRDDQHNSFFGNGKLFYKETRFNSMPFIGFACGGDKALTIHNIKIVGEPTIPREVNLINNQNMRGWTGVYYGSRLPSSDINMDKQDPSAGEPRAVRSRPSVDQASQLSWTVKDGEIISGQLNQHGHQDQRCLQYHRPLCDGETLRYEFFYEQGKIEAHPTIDRVAYMLRPDGCKLHWMSTGSSSWSIPKGYEVSVPGAPERSIELKESDWNEVEISRDGDQLTIKVNGDLAYQDQPTTRDGSMVFGFFHDSRATKARIRNVVLTGDWPEKLPENLFEFAGN
ncbi:DUF1583 domain-containing protein [Stieleria sp. JC731]|uniref:DUF1583 domain-containing protein n=1 Tax=Pirellulaceae TaxID=2691357 RepID=UPI001E557087|nr:DUF1583 domain-containing protein [Stieleria sp. JC731]MCC9602923.1 DUF1583 domain-containing protein [Stieleria sp. JC731]